MTNLITYEVKNTGYGIIKLNRPDKRNAISIEMATALKQHLLKAEREEMKFLVITGVDQQMFSAGGDLSYLHGELSTEEAITRLSPMMEVLEKIVHFPVPVIALLNGNALGGGCELATACDIRIAREGTAFGFVQSNIGILPGWGGGAVLYKKVSPSFALDWLTRGNLYEAAELLEKGWLHQIIDNENWDEQEVFLQDYLNKSVKQMHLLKEQFKNNLDVHTLSKEMSTEVRNTATLWDSPEHKIAVRKFLERKK